MSYVYTHQFDSSLYTGSVTVNTGLFVDNEYIDAVDGSPIEQVMRLFSTDMFSHYCFQHRSS